MQELKPETIGRSGGKESNILCILVVRKTKVFVDSPNFQLNNCIPVSLCSYFLTYQFFV